MGAIGRMVDTERAAPYVDFADKIAKASYNWDYDEFCEIMYGGRETDYTREKWKLFASDWCRWWGQLDEGNRQRFILALFDKYPEK